MPLRIAVNLNPYMRFVRNVGAFGLPPMRCRHEFFRKVCAKNTGTLWLTADLAVSAQAALRCRLPHVSSIYCTCRTFTSRGDCNSPHPSGIGPAVARHFTMNNGVTDLLRSSMHQGHQVLPVPVLVYPHL